MKVFISYGHGDHTALVDRIYNALLEAGHSPWKDDRYEGVSGIPAGADFTQVIYNAIDDSDFVVAIVSNCTQDKPYCCDERQHAYNTKHSRFIQIRLDGAAIRLGNAQSYIDMSDVEAPLGKINEVLFAEKMRALFAAFRDPESFAAGGITPWAKFEAHLKVPGALKYNEFVAVLEGGDYVGREWLKDKCISWAEDASIPCRLFVILGEAGTGKTTFIRNLAADKQLVRSIHVCVYDKPSTRTAKDTLKDLAYILAQNNNRYFNFLKNKNFEQIDTLGIDGLFEFLFIEPLKTETEKYLLIIDGLDELDEITGFNPLMQVFRQYAHNINPNVSFLVTGRPDENITSKLRTVNGGKPLNSVLLDKDASRDDLIRYIAVKLGALGCYTEVLAAKLLDACDGNFEYLSLLFKEAEEEGLVLTEAINVPRGLNERYTQYLDRRMEKAGLDTRFNKKQRMLLSVLCASCEPLPLSLLAKAVGEDEYDVLDELCVFGSIIRQKQSSNGDILVSLFTKGFRDYLVNKSFIGYSADARLGTRAIAEHIISSYGSLADFKKTPYVDRNGFTHLLTYGNSYPDEVKGYLAALNAEDADAAILKITNALATGKKDVISCYAKLNQAIDPERGALTRLKEWREKDTLLELADAFEAVGDTPRALYLRGDAFRLEDGAAAAKKSAECYKAACAILEARHAKGYDYRTARTLALIYERIGIVEKYDNTPDADARAEEWHKKALALDEENYKANPCYETRRDLSYSYYHFGVICKRKLKNEEAKEWYNKSIVLRMQNHKEKPCYDSRRALAIALEQLGDVTKRERTAEAYSTANNLYEEALLLAQQNYKENPCFTCRRNLSIVLVRLADLATSDNTPEGDEKATPLLVRAIELYEQNYKENPCFDSRRGVSITRVRLADIAKRKHSPEGDAKALALLESTLVLNEQNYKDNPCYESRRDIAITYGRLGDIAKRNATPENVQRAHSLYLKAVELYEQNYKNTPRDQSERDLYFAYKDLELNAKLKGAPNGELEAITWRWKQQELYS